MTKFLWKLLPLVLFGSLSFVSFAQATNVLLNGGLESWASGTPQFFSSSTLNGGILAEATGVSCESGSCALMLAIPTDTTTLSWAEISQQIGSFATNTYRAGGRVYPDTNTQYTQAVCMAWTSSAYLTDLFGPSSSTIEYWNDGMSQWTPYTDFNTFAAQDISCIQPTTTLSWRDFQYSMPSGQQPQWHGANPMWVHFFVPYTPMNYPTTTIDSLLDNLFVDRVGIAPTTPTPMILEDFPSFDNFINKNYNTIITIAVSFITFALVLAIVEILSKLKKFFDTTV